MKYPIKLGILSITLTQILIINLCLQLKWVHCLSELNVLRYKHVFYFVSIFTRTALAN